MISADGKWKLHIPHHYRTILKGGKGGFPGKYHNIMIDTALFDMVHDPYEKENVIEIYPEIATNLMTLANRHEKLFYAKNIPGD